jgi:hypothetical protein
VPGAGLAALDLFRVSRTRTAARSPADASRELSDPTGEAWHRYDASDGTVVLVRPDGYLLGRWSRPDAAAVNAALAPFRRAATTERRPA